MSEEGFPKGRGERGGKRVECKPPLPPLRRIGMHFLSYLSRLRLGAKLIRKELATVRSAGSDALANR